MLAGDSTTTQSSAPRYNLDMSLTSEDLDQVRSVVIEAIQAVVMPPLEALTSDMAEVKEDVRVLKQDVSSLKEDVRVLKRGREPS